MKAVFKPTGRLALVLSAIAVLVAAFLFSGKPAASSSSTARGRVVAHSAGRTNPYVILKDGHQLPTTYAAPKARGGSSDFQAQSLSTSMSLDQAAPLALQSGDFNGD